MIKRVFGFIAVLALIYGALWIGAAFWLRARLDAFAADLVSRGYAIERSEPRFVGFPGTVGLKLDELTVAAPPADGGWRWKATPVSVVLHPTSLMDPMIDMAGTHTIAGFLSAPSEGLTLNIGSGFVNLTFAQDGTLENIALTLEEATIAGTAADKPLSIRASALNLSRTTGHLAWWAEDVTLPDAVPVLGQAIRRAEIAVDFTGPLTAGPLRSSLEAWRDAGGAIEVRSFALDWPPARAAGTATLALDAALQPMGAATIKFQGFFEIVAALQAKGHVHEREATMAKIVLGMLARPSATGEPELSLPITVQERKLSAGPVQLMEVPEVTWDEKARVP